MSEEVEHTRHQTITINKISDATKKSFKTRVISAIIALAIIIPVLKMSKIRFGVAKCLDLSCRTYKVLAQSSRYNGHLN